MFKLTITVKYKGDVREVSTRMFNTKADGREALGLICTLAMFMDTDYKIDFELEAE